VICQQKGIGLKNFCKKIEIWQKIRLLRCNQSHLLKPAQFMIFQPAKGDKFIDESLFKQIFADLLKFFK